MKIDFGKQSVRNFKRGIPLEMVTTNGRTVFRRMTRWRRMRAAVWGWLTKPFRRRYIVTAIDQERGTITVEEQRRWWRFL